jgi:hypothetical protein
MSNPAAIPFLIAVAGFVWWILCETAVSKIRRKNNWPSSLDFWIRIAGQVGFLVATIIAIIIGFAK